MTTGRDIARGGRKKRGRGAQWMEWDAVLRKQSVAVSQDRSEERQSSSDVRRNATRNSRSVREDRPAAVQQPVAAELDPRLDDPPERAEVVVCRIGDEEGIVGEQAAGGERGQRRGQVWRGDEVRQEVGSGDERVLRVSRGESAPERGTVARLACLRNEEERASRLRAIYCVRGYRGFPARKSRKVGRARHASCWVEPNSQSSGRVSAGLPAQQPRTKLPRDPAANAPSLR